MRRKVIGLLTVILMIATGAFAEDETVPAKSQPGKSMAIVVVGPVDSSLIHRVITFAKNNTALNFHLLPAMEVAGDTLDAMGVAASHSIGPDDAGLIILAAPSIAMPAHKAFLSDRRVAVVNVKSLQPSNGDAEIWGRRVEREVMQSIGQLLGMQACPNPQCVMFQTTTNDELDAKGRNFCPPCLGVLQNRAKEKGIDIVVNRSFPVH